MQRFHGVNPVGVLELDDGHFAESPSPDDFQRLEVFLAQPEFLDLDEDGLGILQKVRYRFFPPGGAKGERMEGKKWTKWDKRCSVSTN